LCPSMACWGEEGHWAAAPAHLLRALVASNKHTLPSASALLVMYDSRRLPCRGIRSVQFIPRIVLGGGGGARARGGGRGGGICNSVTGAHTPGPCPAPQAGCQ
jgi:hypothetical protein